MHICPTPQSFPFSRLTTTKSKLSLLTNVKWKSTAAPSLVQDGAFGLFWPCDHRTRCVDSLRPASATPQPAEGSAPRLWRGRCPHCLARLKSKHCSYHHTCISFLTNLLTLMDKTKDSLGDTNFQRKKLIERWSPRKPLAACAALPESRHSPSPPVGLGRPWGGSVMASISQLSPGLWVWPTPRSYLWNTAQVTCAPAVSGLRRDPAVSALCFLPCICTGKKLGH